MLRKYTLYLAGFLGLILGSVGCGESHHRDTQQPGGYLSPAWKIVDSHSGLDASCEWAGITLVTLATQDIYTKEVFYDDFNCVDYEGVSAAFAASDYSVALYAYTDPNSDIPATSYAFPVSYPIYPDQTTPLPRVALVYP